MQDAYFSRTQIIAKYAAQSFPNNAKARYCKEEL